MPSTKNKNKKWKSPFPGPGIIILYLKNDIIVAGDGYIEGVKLASGEFRFTGTLIKDYGKKK